MSENEIPEQAILKIFIKKKGCFKCSKVLEDLKALKDKGMEFQIYDVDTVDGLAEASYYGVMSTPTIIQTDENDNEIKKCIDLKELP